MKILIYLLLFHPGLYATPRERACSSFDPVLKTDSVKRNLKNNIYPGVSAGLIWGSLSLNYEREIANPGKSGSPVLYLRVAGGKWVVWGAEGMAVLTSGNLIFFKKSNHLETGLGAVFKLQRKTYYHVDPVSFVEIAERVSKTVQIVPGINAGYRYQSASEHIFFRIGLGFPEGLYAGLGLHF